VHPEAYQRSNLEGFLHVLECCRHARTPRLVYASSSSVYGGNTKVPFAEDDPVDHPVSPYAATKKATELVAHTYHHLYGIEALGLRFFTVYGPRQRPEMAIARFTELIDRGQPVPLFGDGSARRDYTYIDDIVDGVLAALDRGSGYRVYNLGESATTTLTELVGLIAAALGRTANVEHRPPEPGDVPITFADIGRARRELGYHPAVPVREGIQRYIAWYRR